MLNNTNNTKKEVNAEVVMMGKTVKRLANATFLSRRPKVTADHGTQTVIEEHDSAQAGGMETKTANPDVECQTPCSWMILHGEIVDGDGRCTKQHR